MAIKSKRPGVWSSRFLFLVRFLGLTGLLAAGIGVFLAILFNLMVLDFEKISRNWAVGREDIGRQVDVLEKAVTGTSGGREQLAGLLLVAGFGLALLGLVVEILVGLRMATGRRSAAGFNVAMQCLLAVTLLIGVNLYSCLHFERSDWTLDQRFTLPQSIQEQLRRLDGETTVVVDQRSEVFGALSGKSDKYDSAAKRKVVEKVQDLVEQLRAFGPQFNVVVLDKEEEGFDGKMKKLAEDTPDLGKAIEDSPENSIFFYAKRKGQEASHIQRLSFNQFFQLDKNASKKANDGKGNLVLLNQGVEPFARRVLNIDEKKPVVGIAVIHELLTSRGDEEMYSFAGVRKTLESHGFEVRDIVLKKWGTPGGPKPDVATFDEFKSEDLEEQLVDLDATIKALGVQVKDMERFLELVRTSSLADLDKKFGKQLRGKKFTEEFRQAQLRAMREDLAELKNFLERGNQEREATVREKAGLNVEKSSEQKRLTDLKAKFGRLLTECDLLIVPRLTIRNAPLGEAIPHFLHNLDKDQVAAVKDFIKDGKPILACFGPINDPPDPRGMPMPGEQGPDGLEDLLSELGFQFGQQTILYNDETKSFSQRRNNILSAGGNVQIPPVEFHWDEADKKANPIRASMEIAAGSLGEKLDLSLRHPRPVGFDPVKALDFPYDPVFMRTTSRSWNDRNPFPSRERTPHPELTKPDDPAKGTPDEIRHGPFSIGVAVEVPVPSYWYPNPTAKHPAVRVAAIGQGHLFNGLELPLAKQRLLLDTSNWLLGRDDQLPRSEPEWSYPRVSMTERDRELWHWGTFVGLPGLFAYLGVVVLMVRRLR